MTESAQNEARRSLRFSLLALTSNASNLPAQTTRV